MNPTESLDPEMASPVCDTEQVSAEPRKTLISVGKAPRLRKPRQANLRALFWRWHQYAGLLGGPLLILIAVTGAILVFSPEIDHWLRPDLWTVAPPAGNSLSRASDQSMVETVRNRFPNEDLIFYFQSESPGRPYQFLLVGERRRGIHDVWVNPHTGEISGERMRETAFVRIVEQLHRRLLSGELGSSVIELMTGWGIVLTLTGLFLWWPRTLKALRQGLIPTLQGSTYKVNWRLHNVIGAWTALIVLVMCLTGMVFSTYAGASYRAIQRAWKIPTRNAVQAQIRSSDLPESKKASVDDVVAVVREQVGESVPLRITMPDSSKVDSEFEIQAGYNARPQWSDREGLQTWRFDQSGRLVSHQSWTDLHPMQRFWTVCLSVHYGSIFGLPTKLIAILGCLAIPFLSVTGFLIWWWKRQGRKKQQNRSSGQVVGRAGDSRPLPAGLVVTLILAGIVFPTIGASFLLLLLWEGPPIKEWFRRRRASSSL